MKKQRGENLIIFCLMSLVILILLGMFKQPVYAEVGEVTFEPIPQTEKNTENEDLFARTHEVICNEFSFEEARLLMAIAQAEAGNQGADGMWLVMSVVLNRVESEDFPNNIRDVIYQEHQFYAKGIGKTEISPECHEALARIERGEIAPEIVAFEKTTSKKLDKYFCAAFEYRDHKFYTLSK